MKQILTVWIAATLCLVSIIPGAPKDTIYTGITKEPGAGVPATGLWGELKPGPYTPGFQLLEKLDRSRFYPPSKQGASKSRVIRVYLWYPAVKTTQSPILGFEEYVRLASADFSPVAKETSTKGPPASIPVPLAKGLEHEQLKTLLVSPTASVSNAAPEDGPFPLLVLGQGLYYESPLSHLVLCEFLASHGYVVATCPLVGTHYRLVNINVEDLETEIRDLEFVIAQARHLPNVHPVALGIIGYDLGGMAGLILTMRNPEVKAFLSLDAAILFGHSSGLPNSHPSYHEENFRVPWMHITQARFIKTLRDECRLPLLFDRKEYGDSHLVHAPTFNHGDFTSYAMFGIRKAVPGYWGPVEADPKPLHQAICQYALTFFNAYLKQDPEATSFLAKASQEQDSADSLLIVERKEGKKAPPSSAELIHLIIAKGFSEAKPIIKQARADFPDKNLLDEGVLNWLGYHFLYWWGRELDAIEVFQLNVSLFPQSANTYDSLGEAYMVQGQNEKAIQCYQKSLELNPENTNAASILKRLRKKDT